MNTVQFKLPDVGEGLTEADILTWKVAAGDAVKVNQVIVEIETAKPVVELPCPTAGSVAALLAPEGATVEVGTPIIDIVAEDAAADGSTGAPAAPAGSARESGPQTGAQPAADAEGSGATLVGCGAREDTKRRGRLGRRRALAEQRAAEPAGPAPSGPIGLHEDVGAPQRLEPSVPAPGDTRARATPPVRKRAKDAGVDLAALTGTGAAGEVTRRDLAQHLVGTGGLPEVAPTTSPGAPEGDETWTIPLKGVRKATDRGLMVPVVPDAHALSVGELALRTRVGDSGP